MMRARFSASIVALTFGSAAAVAQTYPAPYPAAPSPYTVQPLSDADQLAAQVRLLAIDPRDLQALVRAGELALKLDDDTAAGAFFARAERIDPNNARVKAGEGSLLVSAERPGEALQRFALAERLGGDPRGFAADRGLAYDLIGEPDRAQRDYRVALRTAPNDETQRRYALSLGISGKRELALAQIDPLLRKSDRGAWRARAFILAMTGDKAGAEQIATSMMPAGMAQGLQPFFEILPSLRPADRAFAVHFGEVRASPARLADARLTPPLAALAPDPTAPAVAVALAPAARPQGVDTRDTRRREREARRNHGRVVLAALTTPPPQPLPAAPAYAAAPGAQRVTIAAATPHVVAPTPPVSFVQRSASVSPPSLAPVVPARASLVVPPPATPPRVPASVPSSVPPPSVPATTAARRVATVQQPATAAVSSAPRSVAAPVSTAPSLPPVALGNAAPPVLAAAAEAAPVVTSATPPAPGPAIVPNPVRSEDAILAAIISEIKVPSSEAQPDTAPAPAVPDDGAALRQRAEAEHALAERAAAAQKLADRKAADRKALTDRKAADAKKAAADKKLADAKAAAEEKRKHDPRILEPSRVWVQVAGGANENDLSRQWAKLRGGHAKAFGGKSGWTTPLRATNRILTGPFKSEDDAQTFVNGLAKDGLSGFVFVSDAGQKITKLAAK